MNAQFKLPFNVVLVLAVVLGIGLRWANLATNVYWVDEVHTATRIAGYTRNQVHDRLFDNGFVDVGALKAYQIPEPAQSLTKTWTALEQHPEHPPLYFLLGRLWLQVWLPFSNDWVLGLRSLSVLISLTLLPGIYWLCHELFSKQPARQTVGWVAIALFSMSPLHILYAQEARQYSLFAAVTVGASAALLRAIRRDRPIGWLQYTFLLIMGLYSHLLFGLVAIAHGLYLFMMRVPIASLKRYGISLGIGILAFMPWLLMLFRYVTQVERAVDATQRGVDLNYLINVWLRNLSRIFFSIDLGTANLLLLALVGYAFYRLYQDTPRATWLFVVTLIGVSAIPFMMTDGITGGISSTRIRYLIPSYVGIQVAIAYLLTRCLSRYPALLPPVLRPTWIWKTVCAVIMIGMLTASLADANQVVSWTKSDKAAYYPAIAAAINAAESPVVVSDSSPTYILALGRLLDDRVSLHLVTRPMSLEPLNAFSDIFVFDPSRRLQRVLEDTWGYDLQAVVKQNDSFQLLTAIAR
ncbi:MAG: glycosyltransferase family 39 protein [Cyanobacteria bacterium P01_A01_bin.37]